MYHSVPVFLRACFNQSVFSMLYSDAAKRSASQTIACTQTCIFRVENVCNVYLHYEQTLSNAIHYTSNVSLLQASVNFAVTYRNRAHFNCSIYVYSTRGPCAHNNALHTHRLMLSFTDYYLRILATSWKLKITTPQAATTALLVANVALSCSWW
jgi:hypothetical protein